MAKDDLFAFNGVILKCDKGAIVLPLIATPKKHNISRLPIATVTDNIPIVNIPSFGVCSITGSACVPVAPEWIKAHDGAQKVLGKAPLLLTSYCKCQAGGTIEVFSDTEKANDALEKDKGDRVDGIPWLDGMLGTALTSPIGPILDMFTDGGHDVTEGIGRGFRKGLKGTWNGLVQMVSHPRDTAKGLTKMAGIAVIGYGGSGMVPASVKLQQFDATFGTTLAPTHEAIGDAIADGWDKKVVHGTTEERSEVTGQVIEGVLEAVVGTKGAGAAVKGVTSAGKFVLGAERVAVMTEAIAKLQKAMKLEALAGKIKGIFKVGVRRLTPSSFGIRMLADNPELLKIWNDTLRKLSSSSRTNVFKAYLKNIENGVPMTNLELQRTFKYVRETFKKNAESAGHVIDGEVHHWNYSKSTYPEQITNPKNLTEPIDRATHTNVHQQTTSNPSKPWEGPINPEHEIPINSSPLD
ncbi:hypothetical protein ABIB40_003653 [Pedobacter sp. UYP30]|uniref:DUF4280 domain-containing protein n=1 Tax=Pedobacter sp. UYP30 TaxID=1756400 RepID=UPI003396655D